MPPAMPRTLLADLSGAQRVVLAALTLLFARERGGAAGREEVALADCAKLFAEPLRHGLTASTGLLGGACAAYGVYPARDGWVAVAALEPQFRVALATQLGVDVEDRSALAEILRGRSASDWQRWAGRAGAAATRPAPLVVYLFARKYGRTTFLAASSCLPSPSINSRCLAGSFSAASSCPSW